MARLVVRLGEERALASVRRTARFEGQEIWWDVQSPAGVSPPALGLHDMAATALVYRAMHTGQHLHVDGPVSRSLLEGLDDFVALWAAWRPDIYRRVDVGAQEEVADRPAPAAGKAVAAFSGGLDASYTLWRHATGHAGRRSRDLHAGVLIQGLDIPLPETDAFARVESKARASLESLGVPLATVRTNWRVICVDWQMEFGSAVASALRNWQGVAQYGLLGSDEDYARLVTPWGGHPLHYRMASSNDFQVVYDGGESTRTQKAAAIAGWEMGVRNLRVCYRRPVTGANCGGCEKCLRTKMNFLATGQALPDSLAGAPTSDQLRGLQVSNEAQLVLLEEIAETAEAHGSGGAWLDGLRRQIKRERLRLGLKRETRRLKTRLKRFKLVQRSLALRNRIRMAQSA
jgi:hypothetical protein